MLVSHPCTPSKHFIKTASFLMPNQQRQSTEGYTSSTLRLQYKKNSEDAERARSYLQTLGGDRRDIAGSHGSIKITMTIT